MNAIQELQDWYLSQCNNDWEYTYGVDIETLDTPGWSLTVDLTATKLEGVKYKEFSYGDGGKTVGSGDWVICKVKEKKFVARGGPEKLEEMIKIFLAWAKSST